MVTLEELRNAVASLPLVRAEWTTGDCMLDTSDGKHTHLIVGDQEHTEGLCEFHFRGGDLSLIEAVVVALSVFAGPQLIFAHSGDLTKVIDGTRDDG